MNKVKFSINLKLLFLLTFIIVSTISYFIYSTITIESKDKINNAQQSQLTEVKLANEKFLAIINPTLNTMRTIASIIPNEKTQEEYKKSIENLLNNQKEIKNFYINEVPLIKDEKIQSKFSIDNNSLKIQENLIEQYELIFNKKNVFYNLISVDNQNLLSINVVDYNYDNYKTKVLIYTSLVNLENFHKDFNYLVQIFSAQRKLLYSSDSSLYLSAPHMVLFDNAIQSKFNKSSIEYEHENSKYVGAFAKPLEDVVIFVSQPQVKILAYLYQLIQKIVILGLISLCISLLAMKFFVSKYITKRLDKLLEATSTVASGQFDLKVDATSNDEFGVLADSFNSMSSEIKKLLIDKLQKAQMENEIQISATVQKTLIPNKVIDSDKFNIISHYAPASTCGGDLWNYFTDPSGRLYLMVADATGHGLTSAMITFSAKTVFSVVESLIVSQKNNKLFTPKQILEIANKAVFDSSKGAINMTMFVAIIDFDKQICEYANAGHNPPWLIRKNNKMESLCGKGIRLGSSEYLEQDIIENYNIDFNQGDKLFLYTDGIIEGTNKSNEQFGKKRSKNILMENINDENVLKIMLKSFGNHCRKKFLDDDITLVLISHKEETSEERDVA